MNDLEFEILDELYFIQSFEELKAATKYPVSEIKKTLGLLLEKGWIKCFFPLEREIPFEQKNFEDNFNKYFYIATKAGLLAHNGKDA
jgi:hypothetical protein